MKYLMVFLLSAGFLSCSKEDDKPYTRPQTIQKTQQEDFDDEADTNLTIEEKFSNSILIDFLDNSADEDLAVFLESEIYKMSPAYTGAAVVEITPSAWLVMLEKGGAVKNYLLQKFVDFKTNDYYFSLKETPLTLTDIITKGKSKTSAGE